jgi:hypothetical protein
LWLFQRCWNFCGYEAIAGCPIHRTTVSRGGSGVDFENGAFDLL